MAGPPFCRYVAYREDGSLTSEVGAPVAAAPFAGNADVRGGRLGGGPTLSTLHVGPYEGLRDAYCAAQTWMDDNGYAPTGAPWDSYLTASAEEPDSGNWKTDIFWPVRRT